MKKYLCPLGTVLVLALLAAGVYAASSDDSLISLNYLRDSFFPKAVQAGEAVAGETLQGTYDNGMAQLDAAREGISGGSGGSGSYSGTLGQRTWTDGQTIALPTGSSFVMLAGSAAVTHSGAVVDVTAGAEVDSGAALTANHRYLVGEDTAASVVIRSGKALLGVQGGFTPSNGKKQHTPFYDVSQTDWFYDTVGYAYENGLFSGMDANHFAPYATMSRAMLVTVLYRQAGSPAVSGGSSFQDVADGAWYAQAINWSASVGIASGVGDGLFNPEGQITREQAVVMMYNYAAGHLGLNVEEQADLSRFADQERVSGWARPAMTWAVSQGIVGGVSNGSTLTLEPQRSATRAEMATMLRSFREKIL